MVKPISHGPMSPFLNNNALFHTLPANQSGQIAQATTTPGTVTDKCKKHFDDIWEKAVPVNFAQLRTSSSTPEAWSQIITALEALLTAIANIPDDCKDDTGHVDRLKSVAEIAQRKLGNIRKSAEDAQALTPEEQTALRNQLNQLQKEIMQLPKKQHDWPNLLGALGKVVLLLEVLVGSGAGALGLRIP